MTLKDYHMPKHYTGVYNTVRQNITTLEGYGGIHLILV